MAKAKKAVSTTILVPVTQLAYCDIGNYRAKGAKSHAPRAKVATDEQIAAAHVYDGMRRALEETGQPWTAEYPVRVADWKTVSGWGLLSENQLGRWRDSLPESDIRSQVKWDFRPTYAPVAGNCRLITALELMAQAGKPLESLLVPVTVTKYVSAADFLSAQVRDNEERETGVVPTTFRDKLAAAFRAAEYGMTDTTSDIQRTLGVKYGMGQKLRACLRLATALPETAERMLADKPRKADAQEYSPQGFIPAASIDRLKVNPLCDELVEARESLLELTGDALAKAQAKVDKLAKSVSENVEEYVEGLVDGSKRAQGVNDRKVWKAAFGKAASGSPIRVLMAEHFAGGGFAVTQGQFKELLSDPQALEAYEAGKATLAAMDDERVSLTPAGEALADESSS